MEDKQLNSAESLELIQRMIAQTRTNFERNSGNMFLIWGYTSFVTGLVTELTVAATQNNYFNFMWFAIPIIGFPLANRVSKRQEKGIKSHIDTFIGNLWLVLSIFLVLFPIAGVFSGIINFNIIPFEALMVSIGTIITAVTIRSRILTISSITTAVFSFLMFFISTGYEYVFMAIFLCSMIIPGHILNYQAAKCSKN